MIDLIFASSGIEREIASEARSLELAPDIEVSVARPGHLVALKLLVADDDTRPQDSIDLAQLAGILNYLPRRLSTCSAPFPGFRRRSPGNLSSSSTFA